MKRSSVKPPNSTKETSTQDTQDMSSCKQLKSNLRLEISSRCKQSETCKVCGWKGTSLRIHLNRTKSPCKASYDTDALKRAADTVTREKKALRQREKYHKDPSQKKAAMATYNKEHRETINNSIHEKYMDNWSPANPYKCPICDESFFSPKKIKRHIDEILSDKPSTYNCQICDQPIKYKRNLDRHMSEVHGKEQVYECEKCPEVFTREGNWRRHNDRGKHTFEAVCEYCEKHFIFKGETEFGKTVKKHYTPGVVLSYNNLLTCKHRHTRCIKYHCVNERDLSDEKREALLRKRLEDEKSEEWLAENWEKALKAWREDLKKFRNSIEERRKYEEERNNNSFFCKFCKTICTGILEDEHYNSNSNLCKCPGCKVEGYTHECGRCVCYDKDCKYFECRDRANNSPHSSHYLKYDWKAKVDSGEWKVDSATYEKYVTKLKNHVKICKNGRNTVVGYCNVCPIEF